jgi:hypothetical protein
VDPGSCGLFWCVLVVLVDYGGFLCVCWLVLLVLCVWLVLVSCVVAYGLCGFLWLLVGSGVALHSVGSVLVRSDVILRVLVRSYIFLGFWYVLVGSS